MRAPRDAQLNYARLIARWAWLKLRLRGRLQTDGLCFIAPGVKLEIGRDAVLRLGRWSWLGHGTKIRVHEGECEIGAKTVLGQECTISAFQHVSIGRECVIADRVMLIDFDHGVVEVERPIRLQGIYKRDVRVGSNCWIGYGACILRGVTIGDNAVIGTNTVVTKDVPANAVAAGTPARVLRMREAPADAARELDPSSCFEQVGPGREAALACRAAAPARPAWPRRPRRGRRCRRAPPRSHGRTGTCRGTAVGGDRGRVAARLALGDLGQDRRGVALGTESAYGRRRRSARARERVRAGDAVTLRP